MEKTLITVKVIKKDSCIREVQVSGHGGGKKSKDIVCSAVSAIAQTALSGLLYYGKENISFKIKEGFIRISVKEGIDRELNSIFNVILTTMLLGLKGVSKEYPDRLNLELFKDAAKQHTQLIHNPGISYEA